MRQSKFIIFLLSLTFSLPLSAQDLSQSDTQTVQQRAKAKVEELQGYLSTIANTALSTQQRAYAKDQALLLFIGDGDPYNVTDDFGNLSVHREARVMVSSGNRSVRKSKTIKRYLEDMYNNLLRSAKVVIKSADVVLLDNIHKVDEGKYECTAIFLQEYLSYNSDGDVKYKDVTRKKVKVYIAAPPIPNDGMEYEVKLGDLYVEAIDRLIK